MCGATERYARVSSSPDLSKGTNLGEFPIITDSGEVGQIRDHIEQIEDAEPARFVVLFSDMSLVPVGPWVIPVLNNH